MHRNGRRPTLQLVAFGGCSVELPMCTAQGTDYTFSLLDQRWGEQLAGRPCDLLFLRNTTKHKTQEENGVHADYSPMAFLFEAFHILAHIYQDIYMREKGERGRSKAGRLYERQER